MGENRKVIWVAILSVSTLVIMHPATTQMIDFAAAIAEREESLIDYVSSCPNIPSRILLWVHICCSYWVKNQCNSSNYVAFPSVEDLCVEIYIQDIQEQIFLARF